MNEKIMAGLQDMQPMTNTVDTEEPEVLTSVEKIKKGLLINSRVQMPESNPKRRKKNDNRNYSET